MLAKLDWIGAQVGGDESGDEGEGVDGEVEVKIWQGGWWQDGHTWSDIVCWSQQIDSWPTCCLRSFPNWRTHLLTRLQRIISVKEHPLLLGSRSSWTYFSSVKSFLQEDRLRWTWFSIIQHLAVYMSYTCHILGSRVVIFCWKLSSAWVASYCLPGQIDPCFCLFCALGWIGWTPPPSTDKSTSSSVRHIVSHSLIHPQSRKNAGKLL